VYFVYVCGYVNNNIAFMAANRVYLILGGNQGDVLENLNKTLVLIEQRAGKVVKKSNVYKTKAWGNTQQPDFFNQAILIETNLPAKDLLTVLISIEVFLGRVRGDEKWAERTMDIDILFYNNEIINTFELTIPHPQLQYRRFVLQPLSEIDSDYLHPILQKKINTLLDECDDNLNVEIFLCN
jgi:2-amino-4-hydroxy-6-hydroxymethyldihydropteridine diphosphokinase